MDPNLLTKYTENWVLLSPDRKKVLAHSKDLADLAKKVSRLKVSKNSIYHYVLPNNGYYSP